MPRRNPSRNAYVVRFKDGGKLRAHQFDDARSHEHAASRMNGGGRVLSVRKMTPDGVIEGEFRHMHARLNDIIGIGSGRRQPDVILDNATLDSIVFPGISRRGRRRARNHKDRLGDGR